jgi:hypothetical protein
MYIQICMYMYTYMYNIHMYMYMYMYMVVYNHQIKTSYSHIHCIRMAIPYRTAKFKSANIRAILGSTAKFNYRQYFRLYGINY